MKPNDQNEKKKQITERDLQVIQILELSVRNYVQ